MAPMPSDIPSSGTQPDDSQPSESQIVGLVLVSHSASLVAGLAELVAQMAGPSVTIHAVGGLEDGSLGSDGEQVLTVLRAAARGAGAVVLMDLGSSVLAVKAAQDELSSEQLARLAIVDGPLVEGAVAAGVLASIGASLPEVAQAAAEARDARKL
jgi:phosphoenolpyruvate---glycerone phosphotransferase subunit DhaM